MARVGKSKASSSKRKTSEASSSGNTNDALEAQEQARGPKPNWKKNERLSEHVKWQTKLYRDKIKKGFTDIESLVVAEHDTIISDFESYRLVKCFDRLGWREALLSHDTLEGKIYINELVDWMATLKREDGPNPPLTTKLIGYVNKKRAVLSFATLSKIANFDTGAVEPQRDYEYPSDDKFYGGSKDANWLEMITELFVDPSVADDVYLYRNDLKPLPKLITSIMNWNVIPKRSDKVKIRKYEVKMLYVLVTGKPTLSYKHLILRNVWESHENKERMIIPHCRILSRILVDARAIPTDANPVVQPPTKFCIKGLCTDDWSFQKGPRSFFLTDERSKLTYEVARDDPSDVDEEEDMDVGGDGDVGIQVRNQTESVGQGMRPAAHRPAGFTRWSPGERGTYEMLLQGIEQQKVRAEQHYRRIEEFHIANMYARELEKNEQHLIEEQKRASQWLPLDFHENLIPRAANSGEGSSQQHQPDPYETRSVYMRVMESHFGPHLGSQ